MADAGAHAFVADLFAGLGQVRIRSMFGGAGVYCDDVMFALLADDAIYLKADAALSEALAKEGSGPFEWTPTSGPKAGQTVRMSYWRLPEAALDDPDSAVGWARRALTVARAAKAKPAKRKAPKRA